MSKANPFDQEMTPRKRLVSNIFFAITTLLVAAFVIWFWSASRTISARILTTPPGGPQRQCGG